MRPVVCILGDVDNDPSGSMFERTLHSYGIEYFWLSRRELLDQISYHGAPLGNEVDLNTYATGIDVGDLQLLPEASICAANAYLPVGATLPSFGFLISSVLDNAGIVQPNSSVSANEATNKWAMHRKFFEVGLPIASARLARDVDEAHRAARALRYPLVIKEPSSNGGRGVRLANNEAELATALVDLELRPGHPLMIEQYIECSATDKRVVVVNGVIAGAMQRTARQGEFRANLALGGAGTPTILTDEEAEIALAMARVLDLEFVGLDLATCTRELDGREHLPVGATFCIEGNPTPGIRGLFDCTGVDVTHRVLARLLDRVDQPAFVA